MVRFYRFLQIPAGTEPFRHTDTLLEVLPTRFRRRGGGRKVVLGFADERDQLLWARALHDRFARGSEASPVAMRKVRDLLVLMEGVPHLGATRADRMLRTVGGATDADLRALLRIREAFVESLDEKAAIDFFRWFFHKQFADRPAPKRLAFQQLTRHHPLFRDPDPDRLRGFQEQFNRASRRGSNTVAGRRLEPRVKRGLGGRLHIDLDTVNTRRRGPDGRRRGKDYSQSKNFEIFDVVYDEAGAVRFGSVADGGLGYLLGKARIVLTDTAQFRKVTEELTYLGTRGRAGLGDLAHLEGDEAAAFVARRSRLLVPEEMVEPLRAVLVSQDDFGDLLRDWRRLTGRPNATAQELLAAIQPVP